MEKDYNNPYGYEGRGADIKWCSRIKGRKKCCLCYKYSDLEIWTKEWNWFYLLKWRDPYYWEDYAHFKLYRPKNRPLAVFPINYSNTGLKEHDFKVLLKKGCKNSKKCRCMNVVQRAFWYCPDCYKVIKFIARMENIHPHKVMLSNKDDRNELKAKILILRLSGSI